MAEYKARWRTRGYPVFCDGSWELYKDGNDITELIPEEKRKSPMDTKNTYTKFIFVNWIEEPREYTEGLEESEWIERNKTWLNNITNDEKEHKDIYKAFNAEDWRHGQCGGCI